jgi:hypothetical protein|tara:strand:+ start:358 stop:633 length:276 start_codon:yes stop_codon:yes gene_type:complete
MKQILLLVMAVVMVGCATYDWSDRVGVYTYDQAIVDFGPPDTKEKLTNGGAVASWTTSVWWAGKVRKRILRFDKDSKLVSGQTPRGQRGKP